MSRYFFTAAHSDSTVEDAHGSQFADDRTAAAEILAAATYVLGHEPTTLIITDDTGRVLAPQG